MPNYCNNRIVITGPQTESFGKTLNGLDVHGRASVFSFHQTVPQPANLFQGPLGTAERELYGENNWMDWNCKYWGTKWDAFNAKIDVNTKSKVVLRFTTAWCPPSAWINAFLQKYPKCSLSLYYVCEGEYYGYCEIKGNVVKEYHWDYESIVKAERNAFRKKHKLSF